MKNKIGIITLNGNENYGNRLQNYALITYLNNNGFDAETIWILNNRIIFSFKRLSKFLLLFKKKYKREKKFISFTKKYIKTKYISKQNINKYKDYYDFIVIGSDQIWNPYVVKNNKYVFANNFNCKKISYAASFGVSDISEDYKKYYADNLNIKNIKSISVREEEGKKIIEKSFNRKDCKVNIDPTMLLSSDEWNSLLKKPKNCPSKFVLMYFLGNISDEIKANIYDFAKEENCIVIDILNPKNKFYKCGPSEFLYLEKNAQLVCTDSFHSSVFAILFDTPFIVFDRQDSKEKMNSRLDNLLKKFELDGNKYSGEKLNDSCLKHDYSRAYRVLNEERDYSKVYLINSLK